MVFITKITFNEFLPLRGYKWLKDRSQEGYSVYHRFMEIYKTFGFIGKSCNFVSEILENSCKYAKKKDNRQARKVVSIRILQAPLVLLCGSKNIFAEQLLSLVVALKIIKSYFLNVLVFINSNF